MVKVPVYFHCYLGSNYAGQLLLINFVVEGQKLIFDFRCLDRVEQFN